MTRDVAIRPGTARLAFEVINGRTAMTRGLAVSPLKVLTPRNSGGSCWAYLATYGGGLLGGDALAISVDVGRAARALLSTQASTKVYRSDTGASQELSARVGQNGLLVVLPDPVCCFAGARYGQRQDIVLDSTASLVFVDRMTAGRVGFGERWRFAHYNSRTRIWRGDRLIVHDALSLDDADGDLMDRMGRFNCLAVFAMIGPLVGATAARVASQAAIGTVQHRAALVISASPVDSDGVFVRVAAESIERAAKFIRECLDVVPPLLGDDPWTRRW